MHPTPSKQDVVAALKDLRTIERPEGDNEDDPINSPGVYQHLSPQEQDRVDHAEQLAKEYLRRCGDMGDEPNQRAVTELNKAGFSASLHSAQYDPGQLVGRVEVGNWTLDVGDAGAQDNED